MENAQTENYKGYTINIVYDAYNDETPRDWDNLGTIYYQNNNYKLGEKVIKNEFDIENCDGWQDIEKLIKKELNPVVMIPLKIYDHSGISISTAINSYPFNDCWDSSFVGWILVTHEKAKKEYNVKRISKKLKEQIKNVLEQEIKTFNQFLNGEVYGYKIEGDDKPEILYSSCYGYYELDAALDDAKSIIDYEVKEQHQKKQQKVKTLIKNRVSLYKRQELLTV